MPILLVMRIVRKVYQRMYTRVALVVLASDR